MNYLIDTERLRRDMMGYYGPAMFSGFPMAVFDLSRIERASDNELIEIALNSGVELGEYTY